MRIRSTKPEFWRSKRIASVSWDARLVLKALESYVDDNGVGEDDIGTIAGDCFLHDLVRDPSRILAKVSEAVSELEKAGLVWRYDVDAKHLLFVSFWESFQRVDKPLKGRNPRPDGTMSYGDSTIRESDGNVREASRSLAPGTGEQGNRGAEEQGSSSSSSEDADASLRPEIEHLLGVLDSEIERNGGKRPSRTKKNIDATRLLLDKDGHTVAQVEKAIRWSQDDEFWRSNILSMSKLREKYDQLRLAAQRKTGGVQLSRTEQNMSIVAKFAAQEAQEQRGISA